MYACGQTNRHPFDAASKRFGKTVAEPDLPGPGAYDHDMERNRHVQLEGDDRDIKQ